MSFFTYIGARVRQQQADLPEQWDDPYYEDGKLSVYVHTGCPYPETDLPEYSRDLRPPPIFLGQEMESRDLDRWGNLEGTRYLRSVYAGGVLKWVQVDYRGEPRDSWAGLVLFPRA